MLWPFYIYDTFCDTLYDTLCDTHFETFWHISWHILTHIPWHILTIDTLWYITWHIITHSMIHSMTHYDTRLWHLPWLSIHSKNLSPVASVRGAASTDPTPRGVASMGVVPPRTSPSSPSSPPSSSSDSVVGLGELWGLTAGVSPLWTQQQQQKLLQCFYSASFVEIFRKNLQKQVRDKPGRQRLPVWLTSFPATPHFLCRSSWWRHPPAHSQTSAGLQTIQSAEFIVCRRSPCILHTCF